MMSLPVSSRRRKSPFSKSKESKVPKVMTILDAVLEEYKEVVLLQQVAPDDRQVGAAASPTEGLLHAES